LNLILEHYISKIEELHDFKGRMNRIDYLDFLGYYIVYTALIVFVFLFFNKDTPVDNYYLKVGAQVLSFWVVFTFLPVLAATVRRLHDSDRSGFYLLYTLIPVAGIMIFIALIFDTQLPLENHWGRRKREGVIPDFNIDYTEEEIRKTRFTGGVEYLY